jgi:hypothetical protein
MTAEQYTALRARMKELKDFEGADILAMHCPHSVRDRFERLKLIPVRYTATGLTLLR